MTQKEKRLIYSTNPKKYWYLDAFAYSLFPQKRREFYIALESLAVEHDLPDLRQYAKDGIKNIEGDFADNMKRTIQSLHKYR